MVNKLLRLFLGNRTVLEVALDVNVKECRDAADGHCGAVLRLDCGKVAEVQPLEGFLGVLCRLGDVKAVHCRHLLHLSQSLNLLGDFFAQADNLVGHSAVADVGKILLLLLDEEVDTIQRDTAVVAHDAAAAIGVRKTGQDVAGARLADFRGIDLENRIGVCLMVLGENLVQLSVGLVAVHLAALLRHADSAEGHESALERLVGLEADDFLKVLSVLADVAGFMSGDTGHDVGVKVKDTAPLLAVKTGRLLVVLLFLEALQLGEQLVRRISRPCKEAGISLIGRIVQLNEFTDVYFVLPKAACLKAVPFFSYAHLKPLIVKV